MLERQVFVLRVWRDPHGELRASLKSGTDDQVTYFQNLELIAQFLETRFQEPERQSEAQIKSQPESRRKS
jgi:hypothetical protein